MCEPRKITEVRQIHIEIEGTERVLEKAINLAMRMACVSEWRIDDDGYSEEVEEWERSNSNVHIQFNRMTVSGGMHAHFVFNTWCDKIDDDDDNEVIDEKEE
tara:strand:- start:1343 stop:1648 length:306 start_codon:yes stop_codon:yes gene_type:complete